MLDFKPFQMIFSGCAPVLARRKEEVDGWEEGHEGWNVAKASRKADQRSSPEKTWIPE